MSPFLSGKSRHLLFSCILLLAVASLLLVAGCGKTIIAPSVITPSRSTQSTQPAASKVSVMTRANQAWQAGNTNEAIRLYKLVAVDNRASLADRNTAFERLIVMAIQAGENKAALTLLDQWKGIAPGVEKGSTWQGLQQQASGTGAESAVALYENYSPVCTALVLPTSGNYASQGKKIAAGAQVARAQLASMGVNIDLRIVNSDEPDWLTQLGNLPTQCVAVGGPIFHDNYVQMKNAGITSRRAVFAFRPSLEGNDEGTLAWRFFSTPEDQVQALVDFAKSLDINAYGLLQADDEYGRRMGGLFTRAVTAAGGSVKTAVYNPKDSTEWNSVLKAFTGSSLRGKNPIPTTTFQAAFIPDSWRNMELLAPYIFYQGEDRLVLMGPNLWEQALATRKSVNVANMDLVVFPGVWNTTSLDAPAVALTGALAASDVSAEFWHGVGFDFVRFASLLNLQQMVSSTEVNRHIAKAQGMKWAMAPIVWRGGKASQQLFILHPTSTGYELVNPKEFGKTLADIRARHERRMNRTDIK